jgi:hypothetical protein
VSGAARKKWEVRQYENKEINAGLKVKKVMLKTVLDLSNWYMLEIPSVQKSKSYERKVYISKNLLDFFRDRPLNRIESGEQEAYREYRKTQGAMDGTIGGRTTGRKTLSPPGTREEKIQDTIEAGLN